MMKHPEVIVDTKSLPDGKEETIYLDKGKPTRLYNHEDSFLLKVMKYFYYLNH